jgi:MFS family permease
MAGFEGTETPAIANSIPRVIAASSVGTLIEWYDFYLFGILAAVLAPKLYPPGNDTFAYIAYLATFAIGFVVRPFGALFFGRLGDLVGRKYAFLVTLSIMGFSTFVIGCIPSFKTVGYVAPIALIVIRVLQGLALGGEYGGAAVYVGEHVPDNKRGFYTSLIQITASLGLFVSLMVVLITKSVMTKEQFSDFGWRIPFLISIVLVLISLYIRARMKESPIFQQMKSAGLTSSQPIVDAFTKWSNLKVVLISLFGATAGQGVIFYTSQFFALFYIQTVLKIEANTAYIIVAIAIFCGMPFFAIVGALSDRIGRKRLIMLGCLLAAVSYIPIYKAMIVAAGNNVVTVKSIKSPVTGAFTLTPLTNGPATAATATAAAPALVPAKVASSPNLPLMTFLIFLQVLLVTLVYGPIAAYLIEAFPAKVRYTSMSLPYHIGNGVFGGLVPLIGVATIASTGNILAGLYFSIAVAAITFVVGMIFMQETHGVRLWDDAGQPVTAAAAD